MLSEQGENVTLDVPERTTDRCETARSRAGTTRPSSVRAALEKVGFEEVRIGERQPFGIDDAATFPLFTDEVVDLMWKLIPPERQGAAAFSVIAKARKPR